MFWLATFVKRVKIMLHKTTLSSCAQHDPSKNSTPRGSSITTRTTTSPRLLALLSLRLVFGRIPQLCALGAVPKRKRQTHPCQNLVPIPFFRAPRQSSPPSTDLPLLGCGFALQSHARVVEPLALAVIAVAGHHLRQRHLAARHTVLLRLVGRRRALFRGRAVRGKRECK